MYNTTPKFKENIYAPVRRTAGRVTFDISDVTASGDVTSIVTTSESPLSVKAQLINKVRSSLHKTATWEKDRFGLDGTFSFPDDTLSNNGELGWSSAGLSGDDGTFETRNTCFMDGETTVSNWGSDTSGVVNSHVVPVGFFPMFGDKVAKWTKTPATGTGNAHFNKAYFTTEQSTEWTFSCYVRRGDGKPVTSVGQIYLYISNNANVTVVPDQIIDCGNGWYRIIRTRLVSVLGAVTLFGFSALDGTTDWYFDGWQVEAREFATDYVNGVRPAPSLEFNFSSNHSSAGLTVTFDSVNGEYATDFDMTAYDSTGAVITTTSVTGNTDIIAVPIGQLYNYRKVSVTIKKWSKPNRRARVMEVDFGFVKQYTDDQLINMSLVEEMDLMTGRLPSPEFKFTIDNSDRLFNILNPTGFYKYLQQKQQVIGEIGLDTGGGNIEYIPIANFLLQEWQSDQGSLTATFTARSNLDMMASFDVENLTPLTQSLYDLTVWMFGYCGITNYYIDPALQSVTTNTLIEKTNFRDLLQMVALAGCANIYVSRDNKITLKCKPTRKVRYIRDWIKGGSNANTANHWIEVQAINSSGTNVALGKIVTTNFVPTNGTFGLIVDGDTSATASSYLGVDAGSSNPTYVQVDLGSIMDIKELKVWHFHLDGRIYNGTKTEVSADGVTWKTVYDSTISGTYAETSAGRTYAMETTTGDMTPNDTADFDNMYTEPQIALDKAIKRVEVTHFTNLSTSAVVGVNHSVNTVGDTLKLQKNTLINTAARAQAVAEWMMSQVQYRATYSTRWRGNPAVELNDVLSFENTYGANMSAYVTRNELEYAGYLQARTQAKGVVN